VGAALPGGGNGLTDIGYAIRNGSTWLLADDNDNGVLDADDMGVLFSGVQRFTEDDFPRSTFITVGTDGNDNLVGTDGDDIIFGLGGDDTILGLGGNDRLDGGDGNDFVDGGTGFDNLFGGAGNDTLTVRDNDFGGVAEGGDGDDLLIGADAQFTSSSLNGGAGNDTLRAGANGDASLVDFDGGDDRLEGGAGDDQFFGGPGTDMFVFGTVWTNPDSGFTDIIFDLEQDVEKIDLRASGLQFEDLTIDDSGFSAIVTASAGRIEVSGFGEQGNGGRGLLESDFLFA
jgi:Ca2+-binding RTX toxin-like protein